MARRHVLTQARRLTLVAGLGLAMACSPVYRNHGFIPPEEDLARIAVGSDTRESVISAFGPPTAGGVLDNSGIYYVQSRFRHFGALAPEEIEREVLAFSFGPGGVLTNIERFGLEDGNVVVLSRRVTDNNVADNTLIRQILGNVGRVDAGQFLGES